MERSKVGLGSGPTGIRNEGLTPSDPRAPPPDADLCVEFDYIWPLNIAVLQADGPKEPIACPEFATTYNSVSYRWQLLLYLSRPLSEFGEKYMGLYLCYKSGPVDFVAVDCEMFVLALDHSRSCSNLARKVELEVEGRAWGYANFCPQDLAYLESTSPARLIGSENELKIGVTLRISVDYFRIANFFAQFHPSKEAERLSAYLFEKVCLDFEFGQERADCRIVANDGAGFYANRAVLEYASPVLRNLLQKTNPFVGKDQSYNEINVDDLSSQALREILHYVYKGVPSEHLPAIAIEVVHGAHKFQLPNLKTLCEKAMVFQLCEKNVIKYLYTAETYGLPILLNMSLNMLIDRWPLIFASKEADVLVQDRILVKKVIEASSARVNCHLNLVKTERQKILPPLPLEPPPMEAGVFPEGTGPFGTLGQGGMPEPLVKPPLAPYVDKLGERHLYPVHPSMMGSMVHPGGLGHHSPRSAEEAYAQAVLAQQSQSLRRGLSQPQLNTADRAFAPERDFSPIHQRRPGHGVRWEDEALRERRSQSLQRGASASNSQLYHQMAEPPPEFRRQQKQLPQLPTDKRNGVVNGSAFGDPVQHQGRDRDGGPRERELGLREGQNGFRDADRHVERYATSNSAPTSARGTIPSSRQPDPTRAVGKGDRPLYQSVYDTDEAMRESGEGGGKRAPLLGQTSGLMSGLMSKFDKL